MLSRPTQDPPRWASVDRVDQVTNINNVIEPPEEKKDAGWNRNEYPAREWFNWFQRGTGEWLAYLAQQSAISTLGVNTGENALPETSGSYTGLIFAFSSDPSEFALAFVVISGGSQTLIPIANNVIVIDSVSGRDIVATGAADIAINTIILPVGTINT